MIRRHLDSNNRRGCDFETYLAFEHYGNIGAKQKQRRQTTDINVDGTLDRRYHDRHKLLSLNPLAAYDAISPEDSGEASRGWNKFQTRLSARYAGFLIGVGLTSMPRSLR